MYAYISGTGDTENRKPHKFGVGVELKLSFTKLIRTVQQPHIYDWGEVKPASHASSIYSARHSVILVRCVACFELVLLPVQQFKS